MQVLMTFWNRLRPRITTRRGAALSDNVAAISQQHGDAIAKRWWYWRYFFLEAKRQQLDAQRDQ